MKKYLSKLFIMIILILTILSTLYIYGSNNTQNLEKTLNEQMSMLNTNFTVQYNGDLKNFENIIESTMKKNSYLDAIINSIKWNSTSVGNFNQINIEVGYILTKEQKNKSNEMIDDILSEIIKPYMNDHEKVKVVHDYIVNYGDYDTSLKYFSDYDFLVHKKSVCNGYAILMYNMLNKLNISTTLIKGFANGEHHIWNIVLLDDYWFHIDVTWDDPISSTSNDNISYKYYLLTEKEISKDHTILNNQNYPSSTKNYYEYLNELSQGNDNHIYQRLIIDIELDIYDAKNTASTIDKLSQIINDKITYKPKKISARFDKNINHDDIYNSISQLFQYDYIHEIQYEPFYLDKNEQYYILNLYITYKDDIDYIITNMSESVYNIATNLDFKVYAVKNTQKIDITKDVKIYPYNTNFIDISQNTIIFKDAGRDSIYFEYNGKKEIVNLSAIHKDGFKYITDKKLNNQINVKIFDNYINFDSLGQLPFIENGRTFVALRAIFETLNCEVSSNIVDNSAIIKHNNNKITIKPNSKIAYVNDTPISLDAPAQLINGRIMIPLRFVIEALNRIILWDDIEKTVLIY